MRRLLVVLALLASAFGQSPLTISGGTSSGMVAGQANPLTIITPSPLPSGTVQVPYSVVIQATGGTPSYSCAVTSGSLPNGLSLTAATCTISGTPQTSTTSVFTIKLTDSAGGSVSQQYSLSIAGGIGSVADENYYDNTNNTCNNTLMGTTDGPVTLPTLCYNTALSNTNNAAPGSTFWVCPTGQAVPANCATAYHTVAAMLTDIGNGTIPCGSVVKIVSTSNGGPTGTQDTYTEKNLTFPADSCTDGHYIFVETDQLASMPAEGVRVTPGWIGIPSLNGYPNYAQPSTPGIYMPKIMDSAFSQSALTLTSSNGGAVTSHIRFIGIEFAQPAPTSPPCSGQNCITGWQNDIVSAGCSGGPTVCPDHIIWDRCIFGPDDPTQLYTINIGLQVSGAYMGVIDSWFWGILNLKGASGFAGESHAVVWGNTASGPTTGPYKFLNNFFTASAENIFSGGALSPLNSTPDQNEIRRNHFYKPLIWMPSNPNYIGQIILVKNIIETKNIASSLWEGNIFENVWYGKDATGANVGDQFGQAITFNSSVQNGLGPYRSYNRNVAFRYNIIRNANACIYLTASSSPGAGILPPGKVVPYTDHLSVHDNLCDNISGFFVSNPNHISSNIPGLTDGRALVIENQILGQGTNGTINNFSVTHNTVITTTLTQDITVASISVAGGTATLTGTAPPPYTWTGAKKVKVWDSCTGFNQNASATLTSSTPVAVITYSTSAAGTCNSGFVSMITTQGTAYSANEVGSDNLISSITETGNTVAVYVVKTFPLQMGAGNGIPTGATGQGTFTIWGVTTVNGVANTAYNNNSVTNPTWSTTGFTRCSGVGTGTTYGSGTVTGCLAGGDAIIFFTHPTSGLPSGAVNGGSYISYWSNQGQNNYGPNPNLGWKNMVFSGNIVAGKMSKSGGACMTACTTSNDVVNNSGLFATTTNSPIDLADFVMMTPRTTNFMAGTNSQGSWKDSDLKKLWFIKCGSGCTRGYPSDVRLYDSNHIYWWLTDNNFTLDPSAYKRFVTPVPLMPRFLTPGVSVDSGEIVGPNTVEVAAGGGSCSESPISLGHIHGVTSGPVNTVWGTLNGGSAIPTIEVDYFWGGTNGSSVYNTRERYFYAQSFGLVQWDTASWNGTSYTINQTSTFTTFSTGGSATPQFTCSNQPWWQGGQPGVGGNAANFPSTAAQVQCNVFATEEESASITTDTLPANNAATSDLTFNTVGFNNYNWDNMGQGVTNLNDLALAPTSPYKAGWCGTDNLDAGANINLINQNTSGVQ